MKKIVTQLTQKLLTFKAVLMLYLWMPKGVYAQTSNPFDTKEVIPDSAGSSFPEKMVWIMKIGMKLGLAFALLGLVLGGIWLMITGLKSGQREGQWGEFFMGLVMVIIAVVIAVTLGNMAWQWIDSLSV